MKKEKHSLDVEQDSLVSRETSDTECPFCEIGVLELVERHPFLEQDKEGPIFLDAEICNECGEYMLSEADMSTLLTEQDRRKGKGYLKTVVKDGQISKYSLN